LTILTCHFGDYHPLLIHHTVPEHTPTSVLAKMLWPAAEKSTNIQGNEQRALLLHLATMAEIPVSIMDWLINNQVIDSIFDLTIISLDDIITTQEEYQSSTSMNAHPWSYIVSCNLKSLIIWLHSYRCTFGEYPHPCILSKDNFKTHPELLRFQWHKQGINLATVTSNCHFGSQSISQRHSSYKVLAYPSFSGHAKDWIKFERDLNAIATAQGFGYILQSETNFSTRSFQQHDYLLDSAFIYNVLKYCWSDSTSSYIVNQHAPCKNGRQLYLDAEKYFCSRIDASPCPLPNSYDRQQAIKLRIAQLQLQCKNKSNPNLHCTSVKVLNANNMQRSPASQSISSETLHVDHTCATTSPNTAYALNPVDDHCPIMVPLNTHQLMPVKVPTTSGELLVTSTEASCLSSFALPTVLTNLGEVIMSDDTSFMIEIS